MRNSILLITVLCAGCAPVEFRFAKEHLDLGAVLAGELNQRQVELISRSEHTMKLAGTSSSNPNFALRLAPDTLLLAPNDITLFTVNHTPPVDTMEQQTAKLRAWTEDGFEAEVEVTSQPVTPECDLPEAIEFGAVKVGQSLTLELPLRNSTPIDSAAEVDPVTAPSGSYVAEFGRFPINAGAETTLPITFQPRFTAEFTGVLSLRRHVLCKTKRVALRGTGVSEFIKPPQSALALVDEGGRHGDAATRAGEPLADRGDDLQRADVGRHHAESELSGGACSAAASGGAALRSWAVDARRGDHRDLVHGGGDAELFGRAQAEHRSRRATARGHRVVRHGATVSRWLWCLALCTGCAAQGDLVFVKELVDFGPALPGVERYERVELINNGRWPVTLKEARSTNPNFWIVFPPKMKLSPHQPQLVTLRHLPPADATEPEEGDFEVWAEDRIMATLHARSLPVAPDCSLPEALDFGSLSIAETATFRLGLQNSTGYPSGAMVDEPYTTHDAFRVTAGWVPLAPGEEVKLPVSFTPREDRNYTAALPIQRHPLCPVHLIRLLGEGSTHPLSVQPSTLSWLLPSGDSEVQAVTLVNRRTKSVQLTNVRVREGTSPDSLFHVTRFPVRVPAAQRDAFNQLVPGEATIEVSFTAQGPEVSVGVLIIETDIAAQSELAVNLRGSGF